MSEPTKQEIITFLGKEGKITNEIAEKLKLSDIMAIATMSKLLPDVDFKYVNTKFGIQCKWFPVQP